MSEVIRASEFPKEVLWGASMAAHQVEGHNDNDWTTWEMENAVRLAEDANAMQDSGNGKGTLPSWDAIATEAKDPNNYISGDGMGSWERWKEDVDLAKSLGMNALRFSIEWSRVQPNIDTIDQEALNHYLELINYCTDNHIAPVVTLHHFTNPNWIADRGSWEDKEVVGLFTRYVEKVVEVIPTEGVRLVVINEPNVNAILGWAFGEWPPQRQNPIIYRQVTKNLAEAHKRSYDVIKENDATTEVSSAISYIDFDPKAGLAHGLNKSVAWLCRKLVNESFQNATMDHQDYIALNHYWHCVVNGTLFKNDPEEPRSDLGWYLHPESMLSVLREASRHKKPIVITESGLADAKDDKREWFMKSTLDSVKTAISEGIDVRGYLHWSLLDNFEWDKGYWPKFGLVEVDRKTMERKPRPSAYAYKEIIES